MLYNYYLLCMTMMYIKLNYCIYIYVKQLQAKALWRVGTVESTRRESGLYECVAWLRAGAGSTIGIPSCKGINYHWIIGYHVVVLAIIIDYWSSLLIIG